MVGLESRVMGRSVAGGLRAGWGTVTLAYCFDNNGSSVAMWASPCLCRTDFASVKSNIVKFVLAEMLTSANGRETFSRHRTCKFFFPPKSKDWGVSGCACLGANPDASPKSPRMTNAGLCRSRGRAPHSVPPCQWGAGHRVAAGPDPPGNPHPPELKVLQVLARAVIPRLLGSPAADP
eukprot:EG_transcript_25541